MRKEEIEKIWCSLITMFRNSEFRWKYQIFHWMLNRSTEIIYEWSAVQYGLHTIYIKTTNDTNQLEAQQKVMWVRHESDKSSHQRLHDSWDERSLRVLFIFSSACIFFLLKWFTWRQSWPEHNNSVVDSRATSPNFTVYQMNIQNTSANLQWKYQRFLHISIRETWVLTGWNIINWSHGLIYEN